MKVQLLRFSKHCASLQLGLKARLQNYLQRLKLFAALEIIPSYKYKDSYLVLPSKRLATQGEVTSVKMAFESGKFQLLDNDGHPLSAPIPALSATRN